MPGSTGDSLPIRVALATRIEAGKLSSARPFQVAFGDVSFTTHELLVEREAAGSMEGATYSVQLMSFLGREPASKMLEEAKKESGLSGRIGRETVTGRYAVRLGNWATREGAEATREGILRFGYLAARVVEEPASFAGARLLVRPAGGGAVKTDARTLIIWPRESGAFLEWEGAPYRGYLEVLVDAVGTLTVVNVVRLEDYLRGVVPAELSPEAFPEPEALRAQAVAARTYAVRHLGQFAAEGYDLCSTASCQVYKGIGAEHRLSDVAVGATAGEVLAYQGDLADTLYTSTCGGRTEDAENVFSVAQPYLVSRRCYPEEPATRIAAHTVPLSLEAAAAVVNGIASEGELTAETVDRTATTGDLDRWLGRVLGRLGQVACNRSGLASGSPVRVIDAALAYGGAFCLEGRLPFLLSAEDVEQLVPESGARLDDAARRVLAYWIQEEVVAPVARGLDAHRALSRIELAEQVFRLLRRRGAVDMIKGRLVAVAGEDLKLKTSDGDELLLPLAPRRYLFRRLANGAYFSPVLAIAPADELLLHQGALGIDLIELQTRGASFDRSSRFSHWTVRKSAAELTAEINSRERLGRVLELRPLRYGRSGRVAELEIRGSERSITVRGLATRSWLGIRENLFFIDRQSGADGGPEAFVFTGRGWGHGVGLCQVGAYGMAAAGRSYREILAHYYPGTELIHRGEVAGSEGRR